MKVYVKEFLDTLTIEMMIPWVSKNVCLLPLHSFAEASVGDIVIVSRLDSSVMRREELECTIIICEEIFEKILLNVRREYHYNYDYYYMKNALEEAVSPKITTIISGSSYGLYGIDHTLLSHEVNLSMTSQDLYYSLKGIYYVCERNPGIQNVVLCMGYYYFFSDLSKTQSLKEVSRISKVYAPLYHDIHNCVLLPPKEEIMYESNIFDLHNVAKIYSCEEYHKGYFHETHPREKYAVRAWDDKEKNWTDLRPDEKEGAGKQRAGLHNKVTKRKASLVENVGLFQSFLDFCSGRNIHVLLVVTPVTPYYLNCISDDCRANFYHVLNTSSGEIHVLDLAGDTGYTEEDFNDTDHLSETGAEKLTVAILSTLKEIE